MAPVALPMPTDANGSSLFPNSGPAKVLRERERIGEDALWTLDHRVKDAVSASCRYLVTGLVMNVEHEQTERAENEEFNCRYLDGVSKGRRHAHQERPFVLSFQTQ